MTAPAEWMTGNGLTVTDLAREISAAPSTVHRMVYGKRFVSFPVLFLFHQLSAGAVGPDDWAALYRERKGKLPASLLAAAPLRKLLKPQEAKNGTRTSGRRRKG